MPVFHFQIKAAIEGVGLKEHHPASYWREPNVT